MYQGINNVTKLNRLIAKEKASFPIILDFHFFDNKKY